VGVLVAVWPAFGEHHMDIIGLIIKVRTRGDYVEVIDLQSTFSEVRDEISKDS
jgi:hypothetical protein